MGTVLSILGPLVAIVGAIVVFAAWRGRQMMALIEGGVEVDGRVLRKTISSGGRGVSSHRLRYGFEADDGRTVERVVTVTMPEYESFAEGDTIRLVYLPERPETNAMKSMVDLVATAKAKKKS